ncbi:MAG: stage V sporulation protein AA [Lachnospiraceae bacterium]|nr:stage V sporulation protein AA [Lachnospiraceae bacterium]
MDVYIKPVKKYKANGKKLILLKDVAEVYCADIKNETIKNVAVLKIDSEKQKNYLVSIMDIVKAVTNIEPRATVVNMGEKEVIVEFEPHPPKENQLLTLVKILAVVTVLFFGAATAIMSFHSDAEIPKILSGYYYTFFKEENATPHILEIPYSIGLAVGIIVFFNHFSALKITMDPTPIEVEMTTYEEEVIKNQIEMLEQEKEGKNNGSA